MLIRSFFFLYFVAPAARRSAHSKRARTPGTFKQVHVSNGWVIETFPANKVGGESTRSTCMWHRLGNTCPCSSAINCYKTAPQYILHLFLFFFTIISALLWNQLNLTKTSFNWFNWFFFFQLFFNCLPFTCTWYFLECLNPRRSIDVFSPKVWSPLIAVRTWNSWMVALTVDSFALDKHTDNVLDSLAKELDDLNIFLIRFESFIRFVDHGRWVTHATMKQTHRSWLFKSSSEFEI